MVDRRDVAAAAGPDTCVVVPTIREHECVRAYVENARTHGVPTDRLFFLLVTEDFCDTDAMDGMLREEGVAGAVFDASRREAWYRAHDVEAYGHVVPAASHAETSFGLLYMWASPEFEYGVFIDDDTRPHDDVDFFGRHYRNLGHEGPIEMVHSDERWVNVLYQNYEEHGLYPRGYPYGAMDETVQTDTVDVDAGRVVASQGLWTNVPDLDAVRILADGDLRGQAETRLTRSDYGPDFVTAPGNYLTVCSMNLAFRRAVIPAFYQLPMDDNRWDVGRFDDIWSGVFLKRACDVLGDFVYTGGPLCEHNKAPRPTFEDLHNEAPALELNEHVWTIVDDVADEAETYAEAYAAMAETLASGDWPWTNGDFLNLVGERMSDWLEALDALEASDASVATDRTDVPESTAEREHALSTNDD